MISGAVAGYRGPERKETSPPEEGIATIELPPFWCLRREPRAVGADFWYLVSGGDVQGKQCVKSPHAW